MSVSSVAIAREHRFEKWLPWLVWGMSCLFVTYQMALQTLPSVMIADLADAFSINTFGVSLLASSFFYPYVLMQIPAGLLIDRIAPRYCLTVCFLAVAATTALFATATSLGMATASRILQGVFSAPSVVPALFLASMWFPARQFALLAGMTEMIGISGSAFAQIGLAPVSSYFGWRSTLWVCVAAGIVLAFFTWLIVRNKPIALETKEDAPAAISIPRAFLTVIRYPQAWISGLFCGLHFAISAAFGGFWCIPYLMQTYSIPLTTAAAASSMILFGNAFGAPLIGWLSDRLAMRRLPMIVSTAIVCVLLLIFFWVPGITLTQTFMLLFALGFFSGVYALPFAVMRDIMPANVRGTAMGFTNMMCILIGSPVLQPLIGWLADQRVAHGATQVMAYHSALQVLTGCLLLALVLAFCVRETHGGKANV